MKRTKSTYSIDSTTTVSSISKTTLPNGLRVITEEVPGARSFSLGLWINVGSRDEQPDQSGIAHFIEHTVFRHSRTRSASQIAGQFESLGAYINAFTTKEQTCYYVRALNPHFDRSFELLCDLVMNPLFRREDVEKERGVILDEIKGYEDEAEEYILDIAERGLFGKHSLGNPIAGLSESVSRLTTRQLKEFHRTMYRPDNMLVAVAGAVHHDDAVSAARRYFRGTSLKASIPPRIAPPVKRTSIIELERSFQQSHLLLIRRTAGIRHKNRWALSLLNSVVGDGMSSRLHQRIRERHGIAYALYSSLQLLTDCGIFSIYAGTDHNAITRCENMIVRELELLRTRGVSKAELRRAREQLKSGIIMGLESMSSRMHALAKAELEEGLMERVEDTLAAIDAVTSHEIEAVCQRYCAPQSWLKVRIKDSPLN